MLSLYPNPAKDQATLEISNVYTGNMQVQVLNAAGSVLRTYRSGKNQAYSRLILFTGDLPPGAYFVLIRIGSWSTTTKLLKH
jgi:hypothetical protein